MDNSIFAKTFLEHYSEKVLTKNKKKKTWIFYMAISICKKIQIDKMS